MAAYGFAILRHLTERHRAVQMSFELGGFRLPSLEVGSSQHGALGKQIGHEQQVVVGLLESAGQPMGRATASSSGVEAKVQ